MELPEGVCWSCQRPVRDEHFCSSCGRILPHRQETDYFSFLGLSRKLNLDLADLEKRFYALSRKLHPDNFHRASNKEKELSLEKSAMLNDAYRTLKDPISRAAYLLNLEGQTVEATSRQAPPELLEEVFELNEWLAELKTASQEDRHLAEIRKQLAKAKASLEQHVAAFHQEVQAHFDRWDRAVDSGSDLHEQRKAILDELSQTLAKRNYLRNLIRDVSAALEGNMVGKGRRSSRAEM